MKKRKLKILKLRLPAYRSSSLKQKHKSPYNLILTKYSALKPRLPFLRRS